jgi:oligoendopeptidase F
VDRRPAAAGKQSGAYSHPVTADRHPYVFMNYMGERRDVLTLAHELGHAVHQTLCAPLGTLLADTPLTLAETASIFGEGLVFERLLAEATPADKRGCWPARSRTGSTPWSARSPSTASSAASTRPARRASCRPSRSAACGWR